MGNLGVAFASGGLCAGFLVSYALGFLQMPDAWSWVLGGIVAVGLVGPRIRRAKEEVEWEACH